MAAGERGDTERERDRARCQGNRGLCFRLERAIYPATEGAISEESGEMLGDRARYWVRESEW